MNLVKSIYITLYMTTAMAISIFAGIRLAHTFTEPEGIAWAGVLLAAAPMMIVIGRVLTLTDLARTSRRFPLVNAMGVIGVALATYIAWIHPNVRLAPVLAVIGWAAFLLYAYWYSDFGRTPSTQLRIGAPLPEFELLNADGNRIISRDLAIGPTILIFYRGNWCPLCMAQIKELVAHYRSLEKLGVRIALISPQPHKNTLSLAQKFRVNFEFLTDQDNRAARALGIDITDGLPFGMQALGYDSDTVMPTVLITDAQGKLIWKHETDNYRIRPEPETYLQVLREYSLAG